MSANCYYRYHCYFQLFNKYVQGCVLGTGNVGKQSDWKNLLSQSLYPKTSLGRGG